MNRTKHKMVIIIRNDLHMNTGKCVAQGSHAVVGTIREIEKNGSQIQKDILEKWEKDSFTKIVLGVNSEKELDDYFGKVTNAGYLSRLIVDKGWTVFNEVPTKTCFAFLGVSLDIDKITGDLRLYKG